ncbi:hypothetical protein GCM10010329_82870 [Streptomyces spiroverticillatus]|nr:hypothetical protein GCM10010329_82870 [Streptomyces spiroverticillatus]
MAGKRREQLRRRVVVAVANPYAEAVATATARDRGWSGFADPHGPTTVPEPDLLSRHRAA